MRQLIWSPEQNNMWMAYARERNQFLPFAAYFLPMAVAKNCFKNLLESFG